MYVKDTIHYRGLRNRSSTLWLYQATRLTPYAAVTTHRSGVEFSYHNTFKPLQAVVANLCV